MHSVKFVADSRNVGLKIYMTRPTLFPMQLYKALEHTRWEIKYLVKERRSRVYDMGRGDGGGERGDVWEATAFSFC